MCVVLTRRRREGKHQRKRVKIKRESKLECEYTGK
jgi:hypothetical protein